MSNRAIIVINAQATPIYLQKIFAKQGFVIINLRTDSYQAHAAKEDSNDSIIKAYGEPLEIAHVVKDALQNKHYTLADIIATQHIDIALADSLREYFGKPNNGTDFRNLHRNKPLGIARLNRTLGAMDADQANEFFIQPYYENIYRLQISVVNNHVVPVALWREKYTVNATEVLTDTRELIDPQETVTVFSGSLNQTCQQLAQGLQLSHGLCEIGLTFQQERWRVVDYQLELPDPDQLAIMEQVLGYNVLTAYLTQSGLITPQQTQKAFKHILALSLTISNPAELLKLSALPTYYRYCTHEQTSEDTLQTKQKGMLYLVHKDKNLVLTSYASIRNIERLLANPHFASHSATHIVDFYREAAMNKRTNYNEEDPSELMVEQETLQMLTHENQHISRYVKPLNNKANIQDIMRYYIDIYDLYVLHGKAPDAKIIRINTGNPAFLPFKPIIKALRESLQQELPTYARYIMQVPDTKFVTKLTRYCQEENMLNPAQSLQTDNVVIGHGSTNVYYLALKTIIKNKGDIVLITRPTYGLFIDPIYTAGGDVGFIDIKDNMAWKITPQKLEETIQFYNQRAFNQYILNTFIKAYKKLLRAQKIFDLDQTDLPVMPNIEALADVTSFDSYIMALNAYIDKIQHPQVNKDKLKFSLAPRVRALYHINPHNPTGSVYTKTDLGGLANVIKKHPDIYVIDDLAHWGVLYGSDEPATFASIENMFDRTITLLSLSKSYCVPGLRTGVAIANKEVASEMQYKLLSSSSSATLPAMIAFNAVFSTPKAERDRYLHTNSQEYFYRRNLMATLINGIQNTTLTYEQQIKIYQLMLETEHKAEKPFDKEFLTLMLSGMPLVRTLTKPKGCFFHLLDISNLINAKIGDTVLTTSTDVRNAIFSICQIDSVPGEISGNFFNYSLRMSFSLPPEDIYTACKNIHLFIGNYIVKRNPSVLLKTSSAHDAPVKLPEHIVDEAILNKALLRCYLNQIIQAVTTTHHQLFATNYLQNKSKLQKVEQRLTELHDLYEKLLDPTQLATIHTTLATYIKGNETWLNKYSDSLTQLQTINDESLTASMVQQNPSLQIQ